jgi:hypothetical protein
MNPDQTRPRERRTRTVVALVVLVATAWLSRFLYSDRFGLYGDDPARIVAAMDSSIASITHQFIDTWLTFGAQGRPFHPFFIQLFSRLGTLLRGLQGIYWLAYIVFAGNVLLVFVLLRHAGGDLALAVLGALVYATFPADTTQAHLTMKFGGQTSVTFLLLASLAWAAGMRFLAYGLIAGSLTTYETNFSVFAGVPLLFEPWDRRLARTMVRHLCVLGAMLLVAALLRSAVHEGFVSELEPLSALRHALEQMAVGPAAVARTFVVRPLDGYRAQASRHPWLLLCAFTFYAAFLLWCGRDQSPGVGRRLAFRMACTGTLLLVLAYPLTFTVPASLIAGRATRVHLAAGAGAAIGLAGILGLARLRQRVIRYAATATTAALLTGLLAFGLTIQDDYVTSWRYQKSFWNDLVKACPDLDDGTVILVDEAWLKDTIHIPSWDYFTPYALRQMYAFPTEWASPPLAYALRPDWQWRMRAGQPMESLLNAKSYHFEPVSNPQFAYVVPAFGKMNRYEEPITIGRVQLVLKKRGASTVDALRRTRYHTIMQLAPGEWLYYGVDGLDPATARRE